MNNSNVLLESILTGMYIHTLASPLIVDHFNNVTKNQFKTSYMETPFGGALSCEQGQNKFVINFMTSPSGYVNKIEVAA